MKEATNNASLHKLLEEHRNLYEEFLPTLTGYQEMAKRALGLQIEIFRLKLAEAFPDAVVQDRSVVTTVTAREMLPHLEKLIGEVNNKGIKITHITYDPRTFTFLLFSDDKTNP